MLLAAHHTSGMGNVMPFCLMTVFLKEDSLSDAMNSLSGTCDMCRIFIGMSCHVTEASVQVFQLNLSAAHNFGVCPQKSSKHEKTTRLFRISCDVGI